MTVAGESAPLPDQEQGRNEYVADPMAWADAGAEVVYWWHLFTWAKDPLSQAAALVQLEGHVHDLKTWLPDYDADTMTVEWERDDDE